MKIKRAKISNVKISGITAYTATIHGSTLTIAYISLACPNITGGSNLHGPALMVHLSTVH